MKKFCRRYKRRVSKAFSMIPLTISYTEDKNGCHEDRLFTAFQLILLGFLALIVSPVLIIFLAIILPIKCLSKDDVEKKESNFDSSDVDQKSYWCY